jgi:hypothetical protein
MPTRSLGGSDAICPRSERSELASACEPFAFAAVAFVS